MKMKHKHTFKIISSLILLTAFIIGLSLFTQYLLNKDAQNLGQSIEIILKNIENKDWHTVKSNLDKVNEIWVGVKGTWAALIDHQEIDNIDEALSRLQMFIQAEEVPSSLAEAAALKKYIQHIPAKERLSMENIF